MKPSAAMVGEMAFAINSIFEFEISSTSLLVEQFTRDASVSGLVQCTKINWQSRIWLKNCQTMPLLCGFWF